MLIRTVLNKMIKTLGPPMPEIKTAKLKASASPIATRFFYYPFGSNGDLTTVPTDEQPDGTLSYYNGFPFDYQRNLATDPEAQSMPRPSTNSLFCDITTALQEYQVWATPNFITSADNEGTPFEYGKYAKVLYDAGDGNGLCTYESLADGNTTTPPTPLSWRRLDGASTKVVVDAPSYAPGVVNGSIVYFDPTSGLYELALANGAVAQNVIGVMDLSTGNRRVIQFGLVSNLTGLTPGAAYYLSPTVPGGITVTKPTGNAINVLTALTATTAVLNIFASPSAFTSSILLPGWRRSPDGFIEMWGRTPAVNVGANGNSHTAFTFPIPFPNNLLSLQYTTVGDNGGSACGAPWISNTPLPTLTGAFINFKNPNNGTAARVLSAHYYAVGN